MKLFVPVFSALLAAASFATCAQSAPATPGAWPTRPVRILVGFPGGSTPDMVGSVAGLGTLTVKVA